MKRAILVIGNNYKYNVNDFVDSLVIGIDKGAKFCLDNSIKMDLAIGDFDSIKEDKLNELQATTKIIKLNPIKDESDTKYALNLVKDYDEIIILGGITGRRIEHFYANLLLMHTYDNIKIIDNDSIIYTEKTSFTIKKDEYKYISFYSLNDNTVISLEGFKYDLYKYNLLINDPLCLSNELKDDVGYVDLRGKLLIIKSKDDNK